LLSVFALGCVSTDKGLFSEDSLSAPPAASVEVASPPMSPPSAPLQGAAAPTLSPEQLVSGARDEAQVEPAGSGEAAQQPGDAAVAPEPAPAIEAGAIDPCAFEDAILCDTFEDLPGDAFPSGDAWLPELTGCGSHTVDGAGPSVSGTKALRGDAGGYPECMLHADLSGESDVYVRSRVFLDGSANLLSEYVSFLEFGSRAARDDPELRIGVRPVLDSVCRGEPGLEVSGSGLTAGSGTECTGFELEPERWYCVEAHLVRAGANLSLSVSVDGVEQLARDFTGNAEWAGDDLYLKLGRASYGASSRGSVWHDDVAVGRQPIPCEP
jgi:hypothetical protein